MSFLFYLEEEENKREKSINNYCTLFEPYKNNIPTLKEALFEMYILSKLTKEEVLHVAELARIEVTKEELEKYQVELKKLLDDVEKINEVKNYDDEIMIAPWTNNTTLRSDVEGEMLDPKDVLLNAPHHTANYIAVPTVINENESEGA